MRTRHELDPAERPDDLRVLESVHYKSGGITYAYVLLDREDYMRSGHGRPLSERLREEIRRCGNASNIWLSLRGVEGLSWGDGDMRPHLCVPLAEEQRLISALRAAELFDNLAELRAIRERLEPAADQIASWFETGSKRTLTRDVDFFCAPSRMLRILRKLAETSGLKLNGVVEGQQLRIAPEPPHQRLIESARARAAKAKARTK